VIPDPVFVEKIEGLTFDLATTAKYSGKMTSQMKAALHAVWTTHRPSSKPRKKKEAIAIARLAQGDITTVVVDETHFDNVVIDPCNDRALMGLHVAEKLKLKLEPCSRGVLADGRFDQLLGTTDEIEFYVAGIGGRMKMGDDINDEIPDCIGRRATTLDNKWLNSDWYNAVYVYLVTLTLSETDRD
jgi:hypothetical protein